MAPAVKELKRDYFGRFAVQNCKVEQYLDRAGSWKESVTGAEKKRRMFDDILNDGKESGDGESDGEEGHDSDEEMEESDSSAVEEEAKEPPRKKKKKEKDTETVKDFSSSAHRQAMDLLTGKAAADKGDTGRQGGIEAVDQEMEELFGAAAGGSKKEKSKKKDKKKKARKEKVSGTKRKRSDA